MIKIQKRAIRTPELQVKGMRFRAQSCWWLIVVMSVVHKLKCGTVTINMNTALCSDGASLSLKRTVGEIKPVSSCLVTSWMMREIFSDWRIDKEAFAD